MKGLFFMRYLTAIVSSECVCVCVCVSVESMLDTLHKGALALYILAFLLFFANFECSEAFACQPSVHVGDAHLLSAQLPVTVQIRPELCFVMIVCYARNISYRLLTASYFNVSKHLRIVCIPNMFEGFLCLLKHFMAQPYTQSPAGQYRRIYLHKVN